MPENKEAYKVYIHVRNNLIITATGNVLDVRKEALTATINGLDVKNKPLVFEKVSTLMGHLISEDLI